MPKRRRKTNGSESSHKRTKTVTRKRTRHDDGDYVYRSGSKKVKTRNYTEKWYKWRSHLENTKLANPSLEFWEVLLLASDTYDKVNSEPIVSWEDEIDYGYDEMGYEDDEIYYGY